MPTKSRENKRETDFSASKVVKMSILSSKNAVTAPSPKPRYWLRFTLDKMALRWILTSQRSTKKRTLRAMVSFNVRSLMFFDTYTAKQSGLVIFFSPFNVTLNRGTMKANLPWNHSSHESHCIINWDGSYVCRQIQYNVSAMLVSLAVVWRQLRHGWPKKWRRGLSVSTNALLGWSIKNHFSLILVPKSLIHKTSNISFRASKFEEWR